MGTYILLGIVVAMVATIAYRLGVKNNNTVPQLTFVDTSTGACFNNRAINEEMCQKIEAIIEERNSLSVALKRLEWAIFWMCDSLHNTGRDHLHKLHKKEHLTTEELEEFMGQVSNANNLLSRARSLLNSQIVKDDVKFISLMNFIESQPSFPCVLERNVSLTPEQDFQKNLADLWNACFPLGEGVADAYYQLSAPKIEKLSKVRDIIKTHEDTKTPVPLIIVLKEQIFVDILRKEFEDDLTQAKKYNLALYQQGRAKNHKIFDICSEDEYKKIPIHVIDNSTIIRV